MSSGEEILDELFNTVKNNMPRNYTADSDDKLLVSHSNRMIRTSPTSISIAATTASRTPKGAYDYIKGKFGTKWGQADCKELAGVVTGDKTVSVLPIQAGAEANQHIYLTMEKMNSLSIGVRYVDVTTPESAGDSIDMVKGALEEISRMRSDAGAEQNRLEHTINNLNNVVENTTAAESRIRDTDMAKTMVDYANKNILLQAGQAMMATANQSNQGVLTLLQ
ncbi:MAG: hypothetical protein K6A38_02560 [Lachnospiraceae bacterium]|nr:hypothetical protein [Lachnospiraceae bacterium]